MSITWGVLAQSPEPEPHDKVIDNNPDRSGIWKFWFLRRGQSHSTQRKTSWSKDENQQQTQPTNDVVGSDCFPHWASGVSLCLSPRRKLCVKETRGSWEVGAEVRLELGFQNR